MVKVDLSGATQRYYYFNARYVSSTGPATWTTQTGNIYSSQTIEYLGALQ